MPLAAVLPLPLPWPFDRGYMQLALIAGVVVGACAPLVGTYLVQKRLSLLGEGIGHLAFAGVAGGFLATVWPVWTALAAAVAGALGIEMLRARRRATADLALAMFFYGGLAGGVVLGGLAGQLNVNILAYLFGSVLTVRPSDVWVVLGVGAAILLTVAFFGQAIFATLLDEESARVAGLPVAFLNGLLVVLAAVTIVAAMPVVGLLLIAGLMVLPVASAQLVARSFRGTLAWSACIGVVSVVVGLTAARRWAILPGGTIVLTAAAIFLLLAITVGRRRARWTPVHAGPPAEEDGEEHHHHHPH